MIKMFKWNLHDVVILILTSLNGFINKKVGHTSNHKYFSRLEQDINRRCIEL